MPTRHYRFKFSSMPVLACSQQNPTAWTYSSRQDQQFWAQEGQDRQGVGL